MRIVYKLIIFLTPLLVALWLLENQQIIDITHAGFILLAALVGVLPLLIGSNQSVNYQAIKSILNRMEKQLSIPSEGRLVDTTARLQNVEYKLQQNQARLRNRLKGRLAILEHLPQPLIMLDDRLHIVRINLAGRTMLGLPLDKKAALVKGKALATILRQSQILKAVRACHEQDAHHELELQYNKRHYAVQVEPVPQRPFLNTRIIIGFTDITAIRLNEEANASFVAHASHELRTPLTAIIGFIETVQNAAKDDAAAIQRFMQLMHEEAQRMRRLINDLLSLSKLDSCQADLQPVALNAIVASVANVLQGQADKRQMRITIEEENAIELHGDADLLTQIFQNLIDNAIRYGKKDSAIQVILNQDKTYAIIDVINEGQGIARGEITKLTHRFYRSSNANGIEGTGLGLAIVKQAAEHHQGKLTIDSEPGAWSKFTVTLPLVPPAALS